MGELVPISTLNKAVERIEAKAMKLPTWEELKELKNCILVVRDRHVYSIACRGSTVAAIIGYNEAKRFSKKER